MAMVMLMSCIVEKRTLDDMIEYCRRALPEESCAAVIGSVQDHVCLVSRFQPLPNVSSQPKIRFEADPSEWVRLLYESRAASESRAAFQSRAASQGIVGLLHSHPRHPAVPSSGDLESLWYTLPTQWLISFAGSAKEFPGQQPQVAIYQYSSEKKSAPPCAGYKRIPLHLI